MQAVCLLVVYVCVCVCVCVCVFESGAHAIEGAVWGEHTARGCWTINVNAPMLNTTPTLSTTMVGGAMWKGFLLRRRGCGRGAVEGTVLRAWTRSVVEVLLSERLARVLLCVASALTYLNVIPM